MTFTKAQTAQFRTLASMFHPDKLGDQEQAIIDIATKVSAALNNAKDKEDWFTISSILSLVAKHGITKSNYSAIGDMWHEFDLAPKHTQSSTKPKAEPKAKAKPTVSEDILDQVRDKQNASGWDRKKMTAWLGLEFDLFGAYAKVYLDIIFAKRKGEARTGYASQLYSKLARGPMTRVELGDWIRSTGSNNIKNHETHYWAICELANQIWATK